jgi:hypothetical protein
VAGVEVLLRKMSLVSASGLRQFREWRKTIASIAPPDRASLEGILSRHDQFMGIGSATA